MGDAMIVDVAKKSTKRKRGELMMSLEEKEARIVALREEFDGLIKYYNGLFSGKLLSNTDAGKANGSSNSMIACLLEESSLPLSKLVESIFESVKEKEDSITLASVKSSVLLIGQRSFYGVQNPNADVLEDDSSSCLWCWETRDLKLLPKAFRGTLKIRRTCRKKINERITAVSAVITELSMSPSNGVQKVMKTSERLGKVLNEAEIRLLVEKMEQKNGADVAEKEVKREEKLVVKQLEKNKREIEKEKLRMEKELLKERLQTEKELKRLQDEAEKGEKREMRKQLKKQQEEAEKEQKRREKEEAEHKRQLALQKQASILERFLKKSKSSSSLQADQQSVKASTMDSSPKQRIDVPCEVIQSMDSALSLEDEFDAKELWRVHVDSWHQFDNRSTRNRHWGIRRTPKTVVVKELKLTSKGMPCEEDPIVAKIDDEWTETKNDCRSSNPNTETSVFGGQKFSRSKQLLQFDKSHRPAFYGYWPRKSKVVRARCPLVKDLDLDYEIDSDEEWEEEEPGESLSDCDKEEDENMDESLSKADDEDESEDGFFVPDGYLSENEGVEVERMDHSDLVEDGKSSPSSAQIETEELSALFRQLKHLNTLTEHALRKNRPVVILNLMHEKSQLLSIQNCSESEQMCLQALSIRAFPVGPSIEILAGDDMQEEEKQEDCPLSSKGCVAPAASGTTISDSDLHDIVSVIQSCPHGINKVVKSLRSKFPNIPKSHLQNKVREISTFADNRWQVKKEILDKLGISPSPEKTARRTKSIAAFFSKRCLPPTGKTTNPNQVSPQSMEKGSPAVEMQNNTYNNQ